MTSPARAPRPRAALVVVTALGLVWATTACTGGGDGESARDDPAETTVPEPATPVLTPDRADPLPVVTPAPASMRWVGPDVAVPASVTVDHAEDADPAALDVVTEILRAAGATAVEVRAVALDGDGDATVASDGELIVRVGSIGDPAVAAEIAAVTSAPAPAATPEGYALAAYTLSDGSARVVLAGADPAGTFYAAQTLRQLAGAGTIAGVAVADHPVMIHRGAIEGFYGSPWTTDERLDLLAFAGRFKLNTYVYAPKDDPYHRDRWREPYPPDRAEELRALVTAAAANHVRFTFAVSPGVSVCYSDPADLAALAAKFEALYALGVRAFSVALDDIDHTRWNCPADADRYGPPSTQASARAQVDLLNAVQSGFVAGHPDVLPLQVVPTEYSGTGDSAYRAAVRAGLAPGIEVMWTGPYVVPAEITVAHAGAAAETFGRPLYVWDNTPVNDFPATEGRLILAPYARREPGLSGHVTGIVLNPMNQAAASKVQLIGGADFAWNDAGYDPARAHRAAASFLAAGDAETVEALLAFFDLENLAPTSARSGVVSQPQAPALAAALDAFRDTWSSGDRAGALAGLRPVAERIAAAPDRINAGVADAAFLADSGPWLDATALWGQAFVRTVDGLAAGAAGDDAAASAAFAEADALAGQAAAIRTIPGETRPEGPVRVGDGVLDEFLADADALV
jgi:hyaluronoglucosaminidase